MRWGCGCGSFRAGGRGLWDFHAYFAPLFGRRETREHSGHYLQALLVQSGERRNAENLSETVPGSARGMHQQGLKIVPAVLPPLLASEGGRKEGVKLLKAAIDLLEARRIHHPNRPPSSEQLSYHITRRCSTRATAWMIRVIDLSSTLTPSAVGSTARRSEEPED